ncbi:hypothetical protein EW027_00850 [Aeribacillus pallidus]|uniref:hypothetical protein n=1 Tax=Aeribacillus pallidus TaxID=33936 RepID=UPI00102302A8|nr:hypothetical protein [Aeribacillus pallidus]RZI53044.1 hypothetical protein EW027_00850 [Aeribacillus pallidus]
MKHFYFQEPEGRRRSDKTSGSRRRSHRSDHKKTSGSRDFKHTKRKKIRRFENGNMWELRF